MAQVMERIEKCFCCNRDVHFKKARVAARRKNVYCRECKNNNRSKATNSFMMAGFKNTDGSQFTAIDYEKMFTWKCDICCCDLIPYLSGDRFSTGNVDHCHDTGVVRGIICWSCNTAIGKLGDNAESVLKAYHYLRRFEDERL